jgi:hypothetical protein
VPASHGPSPRSDTDSSTRAPAATHVGEHPGRDSLGGPRAVDWRWSWPTWSTTSRRISAGSDACCSLRPSGIPRPPHPGRGWLRERGSLSRDYTPLIHRTTSDRTVLLVLVVPPAFTESQGAEAPLASSTPGTRTRRPPSSSKSRIIRRSTPRTTGTTTASPGGDRTRCRRLSGRARGTGFPGGPSHSRPRSHGAGGTVPATYSCIGTSPFAQAAMTGSTMRQDSSASSPRMKSIGSLCSIASTRFA